MHMSGGGGACDCGDPEAWKEFPSCNVHSVEATDAAQQVLSTAVTKLAISLTLHV
jgi:E3 ubiquitin-protein ligase UBR2